VAGAEQQLQQQESQLTQGLAAGPGPVSCYEGRLEFWRQLWRTLEMSDVICMIVDARYVLLLSPLMKLQPANLTCTTANPAAVKMCPPL